MRMLNAADFQNGGQAKERNKRTKALSAYTPVKKANPQRKDTKLCDICDIEVSEVDKANKRLKIHYVGYSSRFDEWRPFGEDEGLNISRLFVKKSHTCFFDRFLEAEYFFPENF